MRAEEFVEKYGGELVAGDAIALVNGKKQWVVRNNQLTPYGIAIIRDYDQEDEPVVIPERKVGRPRKQYMPNGE